MAESVGARFLVTSDHGNADDMVQRDKKGKPLVRGRERWEWRGGREVYRESVCEGERGEDLRISLTDTLITHCSCTRMASPCP